MDALDNWCAWRNLELTSSVWKLIKYWLEKKGFRLNSEWKKFFYQVLYISMDSCCGGTLHIYMHVLFIGWNFSTSNVD